MKRDIEHLSSPIKDISTEVQGKSIEIELKDQELDTLTNRLSEKEEELVKTYEMLLQAYYYELIVVDLDAKLSAAVAKFDILESTLHQTETDNVRLKDELRILDEKREALNRGKKNESSTAPGNIDVTQNRPTKMWQAESPGWGIRYGV